MTAGTRSTDIIRDINPGDPITASYLRSVSRVVNSNTRSLHAPRKASRPGETGTGGADSSALDLNFTETSRGETATTFTDDNGDDVSINVMDTVTLQNAFGGILTLTFDNT